MLVVYGKYKNERFKALNLETGETVNKLKQATSFDNAQLEELEEAIKELREKNKDWKFEIRKKEIL